MRLRRTNGTRQALPDLMSGTTMMKRRVVTGIDLVLFTVRGKVSVNIMTFIFMTIRIIGRFNFIMSNAARRVLNIRFGRTNLRIKVRRLLFMRLKFNCNPRGLTRNSMAVLRRQLNTNRPLKIRRVIIPRRLTVSHTGRRFNVFNDPIHPRLGKDDFTGNDNSRSKYYNYGQREVVLLSG